ncbi:unnamed protein product (macronuclear) [Paramecium tetraurelia]|uniref:Cyclic nucleotide-binding domain-containing protein n=1 Tax=Paramecium tetraurelia TaxID=5888 RepID=A0BHS6_PARTE|nr:uncharacterized protein GSPATT00029129001 [Paramecium tetraurelia]CAK58093.1 unnamed protein product [Paramecium tetraurelia]|eukprot:XP_001425491.1 hypothetical protein (macronuclear) [Paramecium tetraurelia strain d4-2]
MDLFRKPVKTQAEIEILYKEQFNKLEPFIKVLTLQSHSEYLELIRRIKVYELMAFNLVPQNELDNLYMFYQGRMRQDLSDLEDLDEFASKSKFIKKKKQQYQEDLPEGYLIDRQNMNKIFAVENCTLLMLTPTDITSLLLKHEQLIRQKRHFFLNTFKPTNVDDKQLLCQIADSLQLFYYEELACIMQLYEKLDNLFIIFTGRVQIYTKRNIIMECNPMDFINEECAMANYSAQVLSKDAQLFKIDKVLLQLFPESAKLLIEHSKKQKSLLRRKLIENHIVDLQIPENQAYKFQRQHKFRSMISLDKLFKPAQPLQQKSEQTTMTGFNRKETQHRKKLSTGSIEVSDKEVVQVLFNKNQFTSNRTLQSQTSDKFSRSSSNISKLLNFNFQSVQLTKSSKKVQSLCLLPEMSQKQNKQSSLL